MKNDYNNLFIGIFLCLIGLLVTRFYRPVGKFLWDIEETLGFWSLLGFGRDYSKPPYQFLFGGLVIFLFGLLFIFGLLTDKYSFANEEINQIIIYTIAGLIICAGGGFVYFNYASLKAKK